LNENYSTILLVIQPFPTPKTAKITQKDVIHAEKLPFTLGVLKNERTMTIIRSG
jgi:hypothetical protein